MVRVAVPDEQAGSFLVLSFPILGDSSASRLCKLVAHQTAVTNPEDYGL